MSKSLFDSTKYIVGDKIHTSFISALNSSESLTFDVAGLLGSVSLNYPTGDRTLFNEVKRQPWLSEVDDDGVIKLLDAPKHGLKFASSKEMADNMINLLEQEALEAIKGHSDIYILTSGGLDSRVICGILAKIYRENKIKNKPICLTWSNNVHSRDYVYAKSVADICGFEFRHLPPITVDIVIENAEKAPELIGCFFSPIHLHSMQELNILPRDSIVLAGSYGDSVGRAEFSHKHLIEIGSPKIRDPFGILNTNAFIEGQRHILADESDYIKRFNPDYTWSHYEHLMQGWYMRGMIAHAMDVVNNYCTLYQMFTASNVYGYMWSLHPCCRTDEMYDQILETLDQRLARLPWARTNKALRGKTVGRVKGLSKNYHKYKEWISGEIYEYYSQFFDSDWFEDTGIFNGNNIKQLSDKIRKQDSSLSHFGIRPYEIWIWLVSLRKLCDNLRDNLIFKTDIFEPVLEMPDHCKDDKNLYNARLKLAAVPMFREIKSKICKKVKFMKVKQKYPYE